MYARMCSAVYTQYRMTGAVGRRSKGRRDTGMPLSSLNRGMKYDEFFFLGKKGPRQKTQKKVDQFISPGRSEGGSNTLD
jgi:hypothetical protein